MVIRILRQLGVFLLTALAASVVVFTLLSVVPGDPAEVALGTSATPEALEAQREAMGLDQPAPARYAEWIMGLATGDFGVSAVTQQPVIDELAPRLGTTLLLVGAGMGVALIVAVPLGIIAAIRHNKPDGAFFSGLSQLGVAVPAFLAGILLITVFAVHLRWFPSGGWVRPGDGIGDLLRHLALPALSLGLVQGAVLARYVRSSVLDVKREDYLRTARAKGLSPNRALMKHGLRNAAIPVLTVSAVQLTVVLIGAVVIERVFVINGLGDLLLMKIDTRDMQSVQAIVMVLVLAVLLINLIVDILYTIIDPRLRERA